MRVVGKLDELDKRVSEALLVRTQDGTSPRTGLIILRRFSEAGSYGIGWFVAFFLVGALGDGFARSLVSGLCVFGMLVVNTVVKQSIRRPRPQRRAIAHAPTTYSMPSAHTSMAMVGAVTMSIMTPELGVLWWVVAVALALSRVMLGMHYVGDVLVGAALGISCGFLIAAPLVQSIHAGW